MTRQRSATPTLNLSVPPHLQRRLQEKDRAFLERMCSGDLNRYAERLRNIGFEGHSRVLDAGCGFGQWLLILAQQNQHVVGIDIDEDRVAVARALARQNGLRNVTVRAAALEQISEPDNSFDCIFSYSTVFYTDYRATLKNFHRILKPGGKLYFTTNSWGRFLHDLFVNPNHTRDFNIRRYALRVLIANLLGRRGPATVTPSRRLRRELAAMGFTNIRTGPDGTLTVRARKARPELQFFPPTFLGLESVYEVLAEKHAERHRARHADGTNSPGG